MSDPSGRRARAVLLAVALALLARGAAAQGPDAAWRTLETPHFRVHFPASSEAWSRRLAARLEATRTAVSGEVGYAPPGVVDVVVADPSAAANGSAWPLLGAPRMVLWTTPPPAASQLGHLPDWGELVAVHEYAHLAHLMRPSRQPLRAWAERTLLPFGPLALGAPRWVVEGYATLIEGRLTDSGRPRSAWRAAVLRQWARQGRLPGYARLSSDRDDFLGMSMAYLAGSAFLEWLEARGGGPAVLPRLWAAATARSGRGFDAAFRRVFGASPAALWDRFAAETTAAAIDAERRLAPETREGALWLDRTGATSALTIAPDGRRLAAVLADPHRPARLVVWRLDSVPAESRSHAARRDPEDPAAVATAPTRRAREGWLEAPVGASLDGARFLPRGDGMLVALRRPDRRGFLHGDLARWDPATGRLRWSTRGADVRDADPLPDGRHAVAVRWRDGYSSLVAVDLGTGSVAELAPPTLTLVQDDPRVSPDGSRLAWLEHRDGRWRARVAPIESAGTEGPQLGAPRDLDARGGEPLDLAWRADGTLIYASVARGDAIEIEALPVATGARPHLVTRSAGAALAPAPTPDGETLYYLALDADGLDVRRLALDAATIQPVPAPAPAPVPAADVTTVADVPGAGAPPSRPYGAGRAEWSALGGGWTGSGPGELTAGARVGELLGRWELLALGAAGDHGATRGGALRLAVRPLPATLSLHLASFRDATAGYRALEVAARGSERYGATRLGWLGGVGLTQLDPEGPAAAADRGDLFAEIGLAHAWRRGRLGIEPALRLSVARGFDAASFRHFGGGLALGLTAGDSTLVLAWRRLRADAGSDTPWSLGGAPSSIAPPSARPGRLDLPALAPATLTGDDYEGERLRFEPGRSPLALLVERHRVDSGRWLRLVGVEARWSLPPWPLVELPGIELAAGVARVDAPGRAGTTRWWLGLLFPPRPGGVGAPGATPTRTGLPLPEPALDCGP
jgi:hypothetical protein